MWCSKKTILFVSQIVFYKLAFILGYSEYFFTKETAWLSVDNIHVCVKLTVSNQLLDQNWLKTKKNILTCGGCSVVQPSATRWRYWPRFSLISTVPLTQFLRFESRRHTLNRWWGSRRQLSYRASFPWSPTTLSSRPRFLEEILPSSMASSWISPSCPDVANRTRCLE